MSTFRNQAASAVLSVVTVVALMGGIAPVAYGQTSADLQAQITALLATISGLQGQLAALSGGSSGSSYTFTRDLTLGSTGADVMQLQKFLNSHGATVAASGAGAPGSESSYFGMKTKAAVAAYQAAKGISSTGYFGPITRASVNAAVVVTPPASTVTYSAGCTSATGYSSTTGLPCAVVTTTTSTGACSATGEGTMVVTLAATPASNPNAFTGMGIPVYGITIKAVNSDITVSRVNLALAVTNGATTYLPSSFLTAISAWDGTTKLITVPVNSTTLNTDTNYNYSVSVGGINFKVLKDQTKTLTFSVDTISQIDNNRTLVVNEYGSNSMRATDCGNLSIYDASLNTTANARTITFKAGGVSTLTLSTASDNPYAKNIYLDGSNGATDVEMLRFVANAQTADATLLTLAASSNFASIEPSVYKLYDSAGTLLASAATTTSAGNVIFTNVNNLVAVNTYKTFVIKGDFPANGSGMVASIAIPAAGVSLFRKGDGTTAAPTVSSAVKGFGVSAYRQAAILQFVSGTVTKVNQIISGGGTAIAVSSTADGIFVFKATARGGTLTLPTAAMFTIDVVSSALTTIAGQVGAQTVPSVSVSNDKTIAVADGDTVTTTVTAHLNTAALNGPSGTPGYFHFLLSNFNWTVGANAVNNTTGLDLFKTPDVFLP